MALLGTYIDQRTVAAPAGAASGSFAHGIALTPDFCGVIFATSAASIASPAPLAATYDGTNVTYSNLGNSTQPVPTITTVRFHTIIR